MANAIYPNFFNYVMSGNTVDMVAGGASNVKAALLDTTSDPYDAKNVYYSDLTGSAVIANVALTATTMGSPQANGVFDAADATFTSVSGAECEALVFYYDTGQATTSPLIAYIDTGVTGLPVTPNGSDINVTWDSTGIWKF